MRFSWERVHIALFLTGLLVGMTSVFLTLVLGLVWLAAHPPGGVVGFVVLLTAGVFVAFYVVAGDAKKEDDD